jgi:hypothetical protein
MGRQEEYFHRGEKATAYRLQRFLVIRMLSPDRPANRTPGAGLIRGTNGNFYRATGSGGLDYGTIYSLSVGLSPFVETESLTLARGVNSKFVSPAAKWPL